MGNSVSFFSGNSVAVREQSAARDFLASNQAVPSVDLAALKSKDYEPAGGPMRRVPLDNGQAQEAINHALRQENGAVLLTGRMVLVLKNAPEKCIAITALIVARVGNSLQLKFPIAETDGTHVDLGIPNPSDSDVSIAGRGRSGVASLSDHGFSMNIANSQVTLHFGGGRLAPAIGMQALTFKPEPALDKLELVEAR